MKVLKPTLITVLFGAAIVLVVAAEKSPAPAPAKADQIARGKYLANFGDCATCHTPLKMTDHGPVPDMDRFLSGHPAGTQLPPPDLKPGPWFAATAGMTAWAGPWGISYAANLTSDKNTGLGAWTEEMFVQAMKTGKHMGHGRQILPPMPWQAFGTLSEEDLKAMFAYLRTVPAITNQVSAPVGPDGVAHFD